MLRPVAIALLSIAGTLAVLEGLLQALPVSTATYVGYHVDDEVMGYPPGHRFTVSTGWDLRNPQRLAANNLGFVSEVDFVPDDRAVALIGDSFVEASMLDAEHRPQAQLRRLLGDRPVYGMGSPGTALLDHAQRIRLAHQTLRVRDFVVWVDAGDARQALCSPGAAHSRCLDPETLEPRIIRQPEAGWVKRIARHSALLQYLLGQLKVDMGEIVKASFRRVVPVEPGAAKASPEPVVDPRQLARALAVIDAVVAQFFKDIEPYRGGRLVVLVDSRGEAASSRPSLRDLEQAHFIKRMREHGAEIVDLQPAFRRHEEASTLSLIVGPYDAHLNRLGVELAMRSVSEALQRRVEQ